MLSVFFAGEVQFCFGLKKKNLFIQFTAADRHKLGSI